MANDEAELKPMMSANMRLAGGGQPVREYGNTPRGDVPKHIVIQRVMGGLSVQIDHLEGLVNKAIGNPPKLESKQPVAGVDAELSLAEFMDQSPGMLNALRERIEMATKQIDEILF